MKITKVINFLNVSNKSFFQILFKTVLVCGLVFKKNTWLYNISSSDPACFTINKKLNCYTLDPNCQSSAESALKKDTFDEKPMMTLALVLVGVVLFIIVLAYLWKILRRRKLKKNKIYLCQAHFHWFEDRGHVILF